MSGWVDKEKCNGWIKHAIGLLRVKSHIDIQCHQLLVCFVGCCVHAHTYAHAGHTHRLSRETAGVKIWANIASSSPSTGDGTSM